ncbi:type III-A CRISPR-associated protein Csm2 [Allobaculum sp. JKK-2023]|uniref:type III-A CRISPR-associated protein Csm2 n=1 Tax=Allobaculum sp. JKK-2023 TaxID=3108943 RepID=UPI002B056B41|nr:type III-A CRISPR-associated protein Csm2 [Allobaculum sp. JKK-2023]
MQNYHNANRPNQRDNLQNNRNRQKFDKSKPGDLFKDVKQIDQPLMEEYGNRPEIFLEGGLLYENANKIIGLKTHQIRKVLQVTKEALTLAHSSTDFSQAKKKLFVLLPMTAYNVGRAQKGEKTSYESFLKFIYANVNQHSITTVDDIEMFDQMITSIVAYHKFLGGKE